MSKKLECLVIYDIGVNQAARKNSILAESSYDKEKRRERIRNIISEYDGTYVQNSVYWCELSYKKINEFIVRVKAELKDKESVIFFFAEKKGEFSFVEIFSD